MDASPGKPEVDTQPVFPPPPKVHWGVLLAALFGIAVLARLLIPVRYGILVLDLAFDVWAIYLCLWIRRLEPAAMSLYWCLAYIALQIACSVPGTPVPSNYRQCPYYLLERQGHADHPRGADKQFLRVAT